MKKSTFIALSVVFAVVGTVAGSILYFTKVNEVNDYKARLEYVYQQNFYELVDNVNNIESNLSKLTVSTDSKMQNEYLSKIATLSNDAQNNISVLPIEHNAINDTITYLNQLGGYTSVLQANVAQQKLINMDQMDQVENLLGTSKKVKQELNKLSVLISSNNYSIIDNLSDPNQANNKFNDEWANFNNGMIEYPQLIYDGPFSESVIHKEIKGLSENEITEADALIKMQKWFNGYQISSIGKTTGGDFETYNFKLTKNQNECYAQVSVRDGVLLELNGGEESSTLNYEEDDCISFAIDFSSSIGFENLNWVWSTVSDGFTYVSLTPVIDDVIIYPDEIKIKVSNTTGKVVGWEAKNWAYNHQERANLTPVISKEDASLKIAKNLDVRTTRLCVIPNEFVGETLSWEFMCVYEGETYYVYIDANTGMQTNVLKVVETDDATLLM